METGPRPSDYVFTQTLKIYTCVFLIAVRKNQGDGGFWEGSCDPEGNGGSGFISVSAPKGASVLL